MSKKQIDEPAAERAVQEAAKRPPAKAPDRRMDIHTFLESHPHDPLIEAMLKDVFRGKIRKESEWTATVAAELRRTVA